MGGPFIFDGSIPSSRSVDSLRPVLLFCPRSDSLGGVDLGLFTLPLPISGWCEA